jgi:uracil-DNA glycosylase
MSKEERLERLKEITQSCNQCPLRQGRNKLVFSDGSPEAPFLFLGEAPGKEEDQTGTPFVGRSGKLLRSIVHAISMDVTKDIYICNVIKCRPPNNRAPEKSEIDTCIKFLSKQIEIVAPKYIVLLGRTAVRALFPEHVSTSLESLRTTLRGSLQYEGIPIIVTYHPSALLRDPSRRLKAKEDFLFIKAVIVSLYNEQKYGSTAGNVPSEQFSVPNGVGVYGGKSGDSQGSVS